MFLLIFSAFQVVFSAIRDKVIDNRPAPADTVNITLKEEQQR